MHRTFSNRRGSVLVVRRSERGRTQRAAPTSPTSLQMVFSQELMCLFKEVCLLLWMMSARSTHRLQACHDFNLLNAQHCDSADVHQESIFEMSGFVRFVWFLCLLRCFLTANVILAEGDCFHLTTDGSIARSCWSFFCEDATGWALCRTARGAKKKPGIDLRRLRGWKLMDPPGI